MALVLKKVYKGSMWILYETNDPRSEDFPEASPTFLVGFLCMYWYTVKHLGPKLMKNRKPFEIKNLLLIYNFVQILVNIFFIVKHSYLYRTIFDACLPIDYTRSERGLTIITGGRHFLWLKLFDCLETVFFVLRKSYRQVSFLHVYHHSAMVFGVWVALRYYGGGQSTMVPALNVIVHAVMFSYYLLTCIDSSWKTSVTFKRSLTQLQMVQFLFIIFSFGRALLMPDCTYPKLPSYLMITQTTFMFALFFDFYRKNYISRCKKEKNREDPRSEDFPEASPILLVGFLCMYWYTVKYIGPKLMENRKPFEIKKLLLIYNIVQILVNVSFIFKFSIAFKIVFKACTPIDYSRSEGGLMMLTACRHFFWLKLFDCVETVFFVLRKSYRQISFLHIYHHSGMVFAIWVGIRYYGGGNSVIVGAVNVIVHAVMFCYYLLTSIDSSWKTSITFKRSLTQMQMVQFLYLNFSFGRVLLMSDCAYPKLPCYLMFTQTFFMFALFFDFYRKNYISRSKTENKREA